MYVVFQRLCSMLVLIFFLFGFLSIKPAIVLWRFDFIILRGILVLCGNTASQFIASLPLRGSSMINSYGGGFQYGCSACVQRSLISSSGSSGMDMALNVHLVQFCILFNIFSNFIVTISY